MSEMLCQRYKVISASSGKEAISLFKLYKENSEEINLVITDLIMPSMTGLDVVESICELSQTVKILVFSGVISQIDSYMKNRNVRIDKFLSKPIEISNIEKEVMELLND